MKRKIKEIVKKGYADIARKEISCCGTQTSCCGDSSAVVNISKNIGYKEEELKSVPEGANLGLGCGNPVALASLREGEIVLDLGSGAGFDCFLAANKVGSKGKVIGVDMTPEMVEKANENARRGGYRNVEFRHRDIENLPGSDNSVDVIISNCVINLSPEKEKVFREAFRVLKPGGRLMVSDLVLLKDLPETIKDSVEAYIGCLSGAIMKNDYINAIKKAGFKDIRIIDESHYPVELMANDPTAKAVIENFRVTSDEVKKIADSVVSIKVYGIKMNLNCCFS